MLAEVLSPCCSHGGFSEIEAGADGGCSGESCALFVAMRQGCSRCSRRRAEDRRSEENMHKGWTIALKMTGRTIHGAWVYRMCERIELRLTAIFGLVAVAAYGSARGGRKKGERRSSDGRSTGKAGGSAGPIGCGCQRRRIAISALVIRGRRYGRLGRDARACRLAGPGCQRHMAGARNHRRQANGAEGAARCYAAMLGAAFTSCCRSFGHFARSAHLAIRPTSHSLGCRHESERGRRLARRDGGQRVGNLAETPSDGGRGTPPLLVDGAQV